MYFIYAHACMSLYVYIYIYIYMGSCQNYGPFLGTLHIRCRIILGIQKGTTILTTTHMDDVNRMRGFDRIVA